MNDLEFLTDDHAFLSSQVIHVVALHRAFMEGHFEASPLQAELCRQAQILGQQLAEHFAFEEEVAFVRLTESFPAENPKLQAFLEEHDEILAAFEEFRVDLNLEREQMVRAGSLSRAAHFASVFERHATGETRLFAELKGRIEVLARGD